MQPSSNKQHRVILRAHLIVGRIAQHVVVRRFLLGIAPFVKLASGQWNRLVQHRGNHIDKRHVRSNGAVFFRCHIHDCPHQQTTGTAASCDNFIFRAKFVLY